MQIYVSKKGQRYGPYSLEELERELRSNFFSSTDFLSVDNCQTWQPISTLPELETRTYAIETKPEENLLVIRYSGAVTSASVVQCATDVEAALANLSAGFRVLVDLSELKSMDLDCAPQIKRIMQLCRDRGVHAVVRVIPRPERDIGLGIMSYFHYGPQVQIAVCQSLQEAQDLLANQQHSGSK